MASPAFGAFDIYDLVIMALYIVCVFVVGIWVYFTNLLIVYSFTLSGVGRGGTGGTSPPPKPKELL